jgi:predicted kinase
MRKWMRDKLKRRKKTPEETSAQPAPLQPAYFEPEAEPADVEQHPPAAVSASSGTSDALELGQNVETASDSGTYSNTPAEAGTRSQAASGDRRPRRRRGRGGRGRRRPASSASATPKSQTAGLEATAGAEAVPIPTPMATAVPPALHRASKGTVVLAIGLPGSGKSSWFKRNNISPLSSDLVRSLLFDDPNEQRFQDLVFSNLRSMLRARLIACRPMNYVDATNLTPHERSSWIKLAKDSGYEAQALYFDVPLDVCLERNQRRQRVVSEDIMRKMAAKLKAPTFDEGFSKITVVRVKHKE